MRDELPTWIAEHPIKWGLISGVLSAAVVVYVSLGAAWFVAIPVGILFGAANAWIWRAGGPAHRWRAHLVRRFPPRT